MNKKELKKATQIMEDLGFKESEAGQFDIILSGINSELILNLNIKTADYDAFLNYGDLWISEQFSYSIDYEEADFINYCRDKIEVADDLITYYNTWEMEKRALKASLQILKEEFNNSADKQQKADKEAARLAYDMRNF